MSCRVDYDIVRFDVTVEPPSRVQRGNAFGHLANPPSSETRGNRPARLELTPQCHSGQIGHHQIGTSPLVLPCQNGDDVRMRHATTGSSFSLKQPSSSPIVLPGSDFDRVVARLIGGKLYGSRTIDGRPAASPQRFLQSPVPQNLRIRGDDRVTRFRGYDGEGNGGHGKIGP